MKDNTSKCPFCLNHNGFPRKTPMSVMGKDNITGILTFFCSRCLDLEDNIGSYRYSKDGKTFYKSLEEVS